MLNLLSKPDTQELAIILDFYMYLHLNFFVVMKFIFWFKTHLNQKTKLFKIRFQRKKASSMPDVSYVPSISFSSHVPCNNLTRCMEVSFGPHLS